MLERQPLIVFPADRLPPYSGGHVFHFVRDRLRQECPDSYRQLPLVWIGFSAGVVGAIAAAWAWQWRGGRVQAFFALDGWGVPLGGDFSIYRLSHDPFTHWSSALLGNGTDSFYADPPVTHLDLWRSPQTIGGWWLSAQGSHRATVASFLTALLGQQMGGDRR